MWKKFSLKINLVFIGAVIGLFVGVSIHQVAGETTPGTATAAGGTCENAICVPSGEAAQWRAGNLILNTSNQYANGLLVAYGNVGIGTITPQAKLDVVGKIKTSQGFCINDVCVNKWDDLKTILGITGTGDPFAGVRTSVSNSPTGPWNTGVAACNTGQVYQRIEGVNQSNPPKGCASPSGASGCTNLSNHRDFTSSEWLNSTTIQTVVNGASYPIGNYDSYLSFGSTSKKIGVISLKSCAASYAWACGFVTGPATVDTSGVSCSAANVNQTLQFTASNGSSVDCTCKAQ